MADKNLTRDLRQNKPKASRGCSNLYRYILDNWAELQRSGFGLEGGPSWQELTNRLTGHGQVNARGQELKRLRVREVFLRVQAEVLAREAQRRTGVVPKAATGRAPKGWKPAPADKQSSSQSAGSPFAPTRPNPGSGASDDMSPDELMAGIRGVIEKRSGR